MLPRSMPIDIMGTSDNAPYRKHKGRLSERTAEVKRQLILPILSVRRTTLDTTPQFPIKWHRKLPKSDPSGLGHRPDIVVKDQIFHLMPQVRDIVDHDDKVVSFPLDIPHKVLQLRFLLKTESLKSSLG